MLVMYKIETETSPQGVAVIQGAGWKEKGSTSTYNAPSVKDYLFDKWEINGVEAATTATLAVGFDEPKKITADYLPAHQLTVKTYPVSKLDILIDSAQYISPKSVTRYAGDRVRVEVPLEQEQDESSLVSGTDARYTFVRWNDLVTTNARTITLQIDTVVTATMAVEYKMEIATDPNSLASAEGKWVKSGDSISVISTVFKGYVFEKWQINGTTVVMGDTARIQVTGPTEIHALYKKLYTLTVATAPDSGMLVTMDTSTVSSPQSQTAKDGQVMNIGVRTPQEKDVSAAVAGTDTRYVFTTWSDMVTANPRNVTVTQDMTLIARMSMQYKMETGIVPEGIGQISGGGWYDNGSIANISAPAINKYMFDHWEVNGSKHGTANPIQLTINMPEKVVAVYVPGLTLTLQTIPVSKLDIFIDSTQYASPKSVTRYAGDKVRVEVPMTQEQDESSVVSGPDARYTFVRWNDLVTTNARTITLQIDTVVTATMAVEYKMEIATDPNSLASAEGKWVKSGDSISVISTVFKGYVFEKWQINGTTVVMGDTARIQVTGPTEIHALYKKLYTLTVATAPDSGMLVTMDTSTVSSPQSQTAKDGQVMNIGVRTPQEKDVSAAVAGTDTRYVFTTWSDMVTANPRNVTVMQDMTLIARMAVQYKVETGINPAGIGQISGGGWYDNGSVAPINAPMIDKYVFDHWEVNGSKVGTQNLIQLIINEPKKVVAFYLPGYRLTLQTQPSSGLDVIIDSAHYSSPLSVMKYSGTKVLMEMPLTQERDESSIVSGPDARYTFRRWNDSVTTNSRTISLVTDTTFTVETDVEYKVETSVTPAGLAATAGKWCKKGDSISVIAAGFNGYVFAGWMVNAITPVKGDTVHVKVTGPTELVAQYRKLYTLTVATTPDSAMQMVIDSMTTTSPRSMMVADGQMKSIEVKTPQEKDVSAAVAGTDTRYVFTTWSDMVTANPRNVTVMQDMTLIARMAVQYKVETGINPAGIGQISGSGWYDNGGVVTMSAPTIDKYVFDHWEVNGSKYGTANPIQLIINMPEKVVAIYVQGYSLVINTKPDPNLAITVDEVQNSAPVNGSRLSGSSIIVSAVSPQEKDISTDVPGSDVRYSFYGWNDGDTSVTRTVSIIKDTAFTMQFSRQFKVVAVSSPAGVVTVSGSGWYRESDSAVMVAPKVAQQVFDHWETNGIENSTKDTLKINVDNPKSVTAVYRPLYNLTVSSYPSVGLTVSFNGTAFVSPKTLVYGGGAVVTVGVTNIAEIDIDPVVSGTDTRYAFATWNDMTVANPRNIVMDRDISLTAQMGVKYKIETATLPSGIAGPGGSAWYDNGTSISMNAPPVAKYKFDHWEIGNVYYSSDSAISLVIDKPKKIIARYKPVYNVTISTSPDTGIVVHVNGKSFTSPAIITIIDTGTITIQAQAQTVKDVSIFVSGNDAKYSFVSWGDGNTTNPRILFINKDTTAIATMTTKYKVETATFPDSLGTITVDVSSDSGYYSRGTTVMYTAPYKQFYALDHWEVNGVNAGNANSVILSISESKHVIAIYKNLYSSQPYAYYAFMTSVIPIQPDETPAAGTPALPDSLIIPPGKYMYAGYQYDFSKEGLYRLMISSDQQERIVFRKNIDAVLSGISWIATGGTNDLGLSEAQKTIKAKTEKLSIYCSGVSSWANYLLSNLGINSRVISFVGTESHDVIEVRRDDYQRWVVYDLNSNAYFSYNNTPLSFGEIVSAITNGSGYDVQLLANDASVDLRLDGQTFGSDTHQTELYWNHLIVLPFLINTVANIYYGAHIPTIDSLKTLLYT